MVQDTQTQEEVVTVSRSTPAQVIRTTKTVSPPQVQTEHPQKVFEKKKVIFRSYQVTWYILGIIEFLLLFRFILKMIGANPFSGFTNLIYNLSNPLALPFSGVIRPTVSDASLFEWSTVIAALVYLFLAYGIIKLFEFLKPVSPQEVEKEVNSN